MGSSTLADVVSVASGVVSRFYWTSTDYLHSSNTTPYPPTVYLPDNYTVILYQSSFCMTYCCGCLWALKFYYRAIAPGT